jgi:hypothetical protein
MEEKVWAGRPVNEIAQGAPAAASLYGSREWLASKLTLKIVPSPVEDRSSLPPTSRNRSRIPAKPTPTPFPEFLKLCRI